VVLRFANALFFFSLYFQDHEKFTRQVKNFERKLNQPEPARSEENQILLEKEIDNFLKMQQGPEIPANWRSDL